MTTGLTSWPVSYPSTIRCKTEITLTGCHAHAAAQRQPGVGDRVADTTALAARVVGAERQGTGVVGVAPALGTAQDSLLSVHSGQTALRLDVPQPEDSQLPLIQRHLLYLLRDNFQLTP